MSLLVECPSCKYRNSTTAKLCRKCDYRIGKASSKCYWIDYRANGKCRRERIGTSKRASEHRLREVLSAITEDRHITQNKNAQVTLRQLRDWYHELTEVMQKRSYPDIKTCINNVINKLGEDILVSELELSMVENYRKYRLIETTRLKRPVKPSTINRDVANFRAMLNKAVDYKIIDSNPIGRIKQLEENNVRKRVLSTVEFERLYECCPASIKGPVLIAFYLPMRRAEILNMQWEEIDFVHEFLRLGKDRTKNKEGRVIRQAGNAWRIGLVFVHCNPLMNNSGLNLKKGRSLFICSVSTHAAIQVAFLKNIPNDDIDLVLLNLPIRKHHFLIINSEQIV